ncbi:hypothetical protein CI105_05580 [Candidatus Izimaplasma bacterium ZiA1]|uniref:galactose ABC transporter substrate-binding protein n=1 Tax=Candidatus Izimoplasma sp. ZiA1 TaxID=2024899 RepID=UPI000BAA5AA2|nr:hypothetical protein CI105_05580 [Candidatus Izimaplasma bacterium ZiA1]
MKKLMILLFLVFTLSSCQKTDNFIPLIIYDMNDTYMEDFEMKITESAQGVITLKTFDSQNSQVIQNEIIVSLLKKGHKELIVNPVDRLSAYATIELAKKYDATIIFINREPLEKDLQSYEKAYYIGALPSESGVLQAELVNNLFGYDPNNLNFNDKNDDGVIQLVILKGEVGHQDAEIRTKTVLEELDRLGFSVELLEIAVGNFDEETAYTETKKLITEYNHSIELVLSNNDAMAIGALRAFKEAELIKDLDSDQIINPIIEPWVPIIGIDGLDVALDYIKTNEIYGTILNDSNNMAKAIIELVNSLKNNLSLDELTFSLSNNKYIWVPYQKITNIEE